MIIIFFFQYPTNRNYLKSYGSISRKHATIVRHGKTLYLQDCGSKFGTVKLFVGEHKMGLSNNLTLQCGRTCLSLNVIQPWSIFSIFSSPPSSAPKVEQEEQKDNPSCPLLPSNGIHNVLVINRKKYMKLVNIEERQRGYESPHPLGRITIPRSETEKPNKHSTFPSRKSIDEKNSSPMQITQRHQRRATALFTMRHVSAGDTADDVNCD